MKKDSYGFKAAQILTISISGFIYASTVKKISRIVSLNRCSASIKYAKDRIFRCNDLYHIFRCVLYCTYIAWELRSRNNVFFFFFAWYVVFLSFPFSICARFFTSFARTFFTCKSINREQSDCVCRRRTFWNLLYKISRFSDRKRNSFFIGK